MPRRRHLSALARPVRLHRSLAVLPAVLAALLLAVPPALAEHGQSPDSYYDSTAYGDAASGDAYGDPVSYDGGYSYVRNLRGAATLIQSDGERSQIELNQPLLVGDRLWVSPGSMLEVLLSDGNLLRADGDSEVVLESLAYSPEAQDRTTLLRLVEGNVELVVVDDSVGEEFPRFELPNATVYVGEAGRYRLTSDRGDWSQVVTRDGWAEVVTDAGSTALRPGEEVLVEGVGRPRTVVRQAGGFDTLERWGRRLDAQVARNDYVDPSLRYAAAPLDDHGSWVTVEDQRAWRPYVEADWRPYVHGSWRHTPIGLTWVSSEPWGWVPYHYGTWDYAPGHGWVWFPGRAFAPAWVYWYWGPSHVAWVPVGYYSHRYRRYYGHGLRFGVYGWAGGDWGLYADWVFCPTRYFGLRDQRRYVHDGRYWHRRYGDRAVPRGILTTDTRGITPRHWRDPDEVRRVLRTRPPAGGALASRNGGRTLEMPDVTPFVAGRRDLPKDVQHRVLSLDPNAERVAGTPLAPRTAVRRDGGGAARPTGPQIDTPRAARPRVDVSGRGDGATRSGAAQDGGSGVRVARPRTESANGQSGDTRVDRGTAGGNEGSSGEPRRVVRPRTGSDARPERATPNRAEAPRVERPRTVRPESGKKEESPSRPTVRRRTDDDDDGAARPSAAPRVSAPRISTPRAAAPRASSPRASSPRASSPRASSPRVSSPRASSPRVSSPRTSSPRVSTPRASSPRPTTPRASSPAERSTPSRPSRIVRPRTSSPPTAPSTAPRSSRAGTSSEPPARRVVRGVRGSSPASPSARRPSASRPSTARPSTNPPSTARPSTRRPSTSRPSTSRPSAARPSTSRPSRSGSSGSAARSRSTGGRSTAGSRSGSSSRRSSSASSGSRSRSGRTVKRHGRDGDGGTPGG